MADTNVKILSMFCTASSRLPDLPIKDGQLIFVKDNPKIALDLNGKRKFYNQITVLQTEEERNNILAPVSGLFYFIVESAILWFYDTEWIQVTQKPEKIVFIGDSLPVLGSENALYINKNEKNISIWNADTKKYDIISEKIEKIETTDIEALFA